MKTLVDVIRTYAPHYLVAIPCPKGLASLSTHKTINKNEVLMIVLKTIKYHNVRYSSGSIRKQTTVLQG